MGPSCLTKIRSSLKSRC